MNYLSLTKLPACAAAALIGAVLASGCSNAGSQLSPATSPVAAQARPGDLARAGIPPPSISHIYVAGFGNSSVLGYAYAAANAANGAPNCNDGAASPTNVASDPLQDLMEINGISISVYGPGWCAAQYGVTIPDKFGKPQDIASNNAETGKMAVAMEQGNGKGSIAVCKLSNNGCTANLTNAAMTRTAEGVAVDNAGDCWASAGTSSGGAVLVYFHGCTGPGVVATGFTNTSPGGLDIDDHGNLVSEDPSGGATGQFWVYRGCAPACTTIGGPFAMHNRSRYAHLDVNSTALAAADYTNNAIDVYYYASTTLTASITYWHSFNNGLSSSGGAWGVAWLNRSIE
jgi:hypothetical protein